MNRFTPIENLKNRIKNQIDFKKIKNLKELKSMKKHKVLLISLLSLCLLLLISHGLYRFVFNSKKVEKLEVLPVQTVQVKEVIMPEVLQTVGILLPIHEARLTAAGPGKVDKVLVESGSWVKTGTRLLSVIGGPEVIAPFDGYITDWKVKPGEFVNTGTELVMIVDTELLSLHYRIPEQNAPKLDIGQEVILTVRAYPKKEFKGTVNYISPVIDRKTHTLLLHANVKNPDQDLWPGMFAHVTQLLETNPKALVVPESTLILTLEGYELLVVNEGKLQRRPVQVGNRYQGRAQILSGVKVGEAVLLTRTEATKEGVAVVTKDWTGEW